MCEFGFSEEWCWCVARGAVPCLRDGERSRGVSSKLKGELPVSAHGVHDNGLMIRGVEMQMSDLRFRMKISPLPISHRPVQSESCRDLKDCQFPDCDGPTRIRGLRKKSGVDLVAHEKYAEPKEVEVNTMWNVPFIISFMIMPVEPC
ncbi:hypothetical protein QQ045_017975 [Rhodiola kirilowii]